jgi:hypothetical protein
LFSGKAFARSSAATVVACNLTVPANPFTAVGLATPWVSSCNQADPAQSVFVQAAIFDKLSHQLAIYPPLVISAGTVPALPTVLPTLPLQYEAAIFGGGNDDMTTLVGPGAAQCVNGIPGQVFGQVFFCGARQFFTDVNNAHIPIPAPGVSLFDETERCPTVRDFRIVDQDQSDNVQTTYLVTANGQTAQDTAANRAILGTTAVAKNPSDNRLLTNFVDPVIGCIPWLLPDLSDYGALVPSQAADELQAARYQGNANGDTRMNRQNRPVALIPAGDPMAGPNILTLLNLYRVNVDQPPVFALGQANTMAYCAHIKQVQLNFINKHQVMFLASTSPTPGVNLDDFLLGRLATTNMILGCPVS